MRLRTIHAVTLFLPGLAAAACGARAEALRDPVAFPSSEVFAGGAAVPGCPAPHHRPLRRALLRVREAVRTIGPYAVTLPGYVHDAQLGEADDYAPMLLQAQPGEALRLDLDNRLPQADDSATNLHTHGLIVSPQPSAPCVMPGDYIYTREEPGGRLAYRIDIPPTLGHDFFETGQDSTPYPPGLYWLHAHLHGLALPHVAGGMSGLLAVGDPKTNLRARNPADTAALRKATAVKYLALRDIQLTVPRCRPEDGHCAGKPVWPGSGVAHHPAQAGVQPFPPSPPDNAPLGPASLDSYDPATCLGGQTDPAGNALPQPVLDRHGWCGQARAPDGDRQASDSVWLFTVNGQLFPSLDIPARQNQLWRIANLSPTVTYVLELIDDDTGQPQALDAVTLDGIVAGTAATGADAPPALGVKLKQLLLMPASRAEVFVPNDAGRQARRLTLRTHGITTGPLPPGQQQPPGQPVQVTAAPTGDTWPAIELASVRMAPQPAGRGPALDTTIARRVPAPSGFARPALTAAAPGTCVTLPRTPDGRHFRRVITFAQDDATDAFMLGSDVADGHGDPLFPPDSPEHQQADAALHIDPAVFPHDFDWSHPPMHVCPRFGDREVWELVNTTSELHNFHIHQGKFRLATAKDVDRGAPADLLAAGNFEDVHSNFYDPGHVVGPLLPENSVPAGGVDVWHDTIPVPPAGLGADGSPDPSNPGHVFIVIPFVAEQQVGRFVFHCHILEHEDGGMMAAIEVLR